MLTRSNEYWNTTTNTWDNSSKTTKTYDANNNMLTRSNEYWNTTTNSWDETDKSTVIYDSNNFIINQMNIGFGSEFYPDTTGSDCHNYYHTANVLSLANLHLKNTSVYPNPNNGVFNITSATIINAIEAYNTLGQLVYNNTDVNNTTHAVNFTYLPRGIYFIKINTEQTIVTERVYVE